VFEKISAAINHFTADIREVKLLNNQDMFLLLNQLLLKNLDTTTDFYREKRDRLESCRGEADSLETDQPDRGCVSERHGGCARKSRGDCVKKVYAPKSLRAKKFRAKKVYAPKPVKGSVA
jgi:hypothetical protein